MADSYVCSGATMKCTMGTNTAKLTVLPDRITYLTGKPQANISDHKSFVNLGAFGRCRSMGFPSTASATAAAQGTLTPMPCMHNTPIPWMMGKDDYIIKGQPALLKSSTCQCLWGGTISLVTDGQVGEGTQWIQKRTKTLYDVPDIGLKQYQVASAQEVHGGVNSSTPPPVKNDLLSSNSNTKSKPNKIAYSKKNDSVIKFTSSNIVENTQNVLQTITVDIPFKMAESVLANTWNSYLEDEKKRILSIAGEMPGKLTIVERLKKAENCLMLEKLLGIAKGKPMTLERADKQNANPRYTYQYIADPNGPIDIDGVKVRENPNHKPEYSINCATCSATFALRLLGFDVKAKGNVPQTLNEFISDYPFDMWNNADGTKARPVKIEKWMKDNNIKEMTVKDYRKFIDEATAEEGIYTIALRWNEGGGHATILQRDKDGQLYYIEPQVYESNLTKDGRRSIDDLLITSNGGLNLSATPIGEEGILRVDNKLLNPEYATLFET